MVVGVVDYHLSFGTSPICTHLEGLVGHVGVEICFDRNSGGALRGSRRCGVEFVSIGTVIFLDDQDDVDGSARVYQSGDDGGHYGRRGVILWRTVELPMLAIDEAPVWLGLEL